MVLAVVVETLIGWVCGIGLNHILGVIIFYWFYGIPRLHARALRKLELQKQRERQQRRRKNGSNSISSRNQQRNDPKLDLIAQKVPESTDQERQRFLLDKKGDVAKAIDGLKNYIQWRTHHNSLLLDKDLVVNNNNNTLSDNTSSSAAAKANDENDWNIAATLAVRASVLSSSGATAEDPTLDKTTWVSLPQVARLHYLDDAIKISECCYDRDGYRILQLIPGRIDDRIVPVQTYAVAIALYIDKKLGYDNNERITLLMDCRAGIGWRNNHIGKLLPFLQDIFTLLLNNFPQRLEKAIVYPVPPTLRWIWNVVKRTSLDVETSKRIYLLTGPAKIISDPPYTAMEQYIDPIIVRHIEYERKAAFIIPKEEEENITPSDEKLQQTSQ